MLRYAVQSLIRRPVVALVLCFGLGVSLGLPIAIEMASRRAAAALRDRANTIPLVLGAEGSATDLVFHALEFATEPPGQIRVANWRDLVELDHARTAPLFVAGTAHEIPIVGTNAAYFQMRGLTLAAGEPVKELGDALLGADVARQLSLGPGDHITTDIAALYSLSGSLPVRLNVVGRLAPTGTADDHTIFVGLETAWLIAGLGHSHANPSAAHDSSGAPRSADPAGMIAVTEEYAEAFHLHGNRESFPLTAVLARPASPKDRLALVGHYVGAEDDLQLAEADRVIGELLARQLQLKEILDLIVFVSLLTTIALAAALVWLTVQLRWREFQTMARLGLSRLRIALIATLELAMLLAGACGVAIALAVLLSVAGPSLFTWVVY